MNHITLTIDSRLENIAIVCVCAKALAGVFFDVDKFAEIELALAEAVNNCIEHAYCGSDQQQVIIKFTLLNDRLLIEIIDEADIAFNPELLENLSVDFDYDPLDIDNLPESGFGLKIIKSSMDGVNYRRENGKNHWILTKYC
ncbi:MAG: ATP-binding protein [Methylococcaceae bacterium]|nr:ATP-binding protein [Methylococcaceae bacterium]